jgi:hypothetical protein
MALKFAVNNSLSAITSLPSGISGGALNLISTQTASASASLEFSLDDSYDSYIFKFYNIHPSANTSAIQFQGSTDSGSSYGVTMTSTIFTVLHTEDDAETGFTYQAGDDIAQGTGFMKLHRHCGIDNDMSQNGELTIYNPSSTTFVKHFMSRFSGSWHAPGEMENFTAGYFNTTSAITNIKFQFNSGNIDDGIIKMYGVS